LHPKCDSGEVGEGGGFGFEGGDGFDEAGDGEGVADAALADDQAQDAAFASQFDGNAHQRGDAGAVDLRDAIQDDDDLVCAALNHGIERVVELLAGLADGQAAVDFEDRHSAGFADVDLHGWALGHRGRSIEIAFLWPIAGPHGIIRWPGGWANKVLPAG
jgi:hypothetical protein